MTIQLHDLNRHELIKHINDIFPGVLSLKPDDLLAGAPHTDILEDGFDNFFVRNLLKKVENVEIPGINPVEVAYSKFDTFLAEEDARARKVRYVLDNAHVSPMLDGVLKHVVWFWGKIFSDFSVSKIVPRHTYGATASLKRGSSVYARTKCSAGVQKVIQKMDSLKEPYRNSTTEFIHTPRSAEYLSLLNNYPHHEGNDDDTVIILDVPKYAKEARLIGLQVTYLMSIQNGVGDYLEPKLRAHANIDIRTAQDLHKRLAMESSLTGENCTADQTNASNNILRILIQHLMSKCPDLYELLDLISPTKVEVQGTVKTTRMMATQGNGYIFPLQTLLFYSLIKGIQHYRKVNYDVHVYGDDVICHHTLFEDVEQVFGALGLIINYDKSFSDGPFRESCGGDFLYGINVRPFYVSNIPTNTIEWIRFVNGVRRVGYYNNASTWTSSRLRTLWFRCILSIPKDERLFCPRHYGDSGINTECEQLYRFARPRQHDAEGKRYPNRGLDKTGKHYFGSEYIYIYQESRRGVKTDFNDETRGIKADTVVRLLSEPSLIGSGLRASKTGDLYYPPFFGGTHDKYERTKVPYTLIGQAPEDVDALFDMLTQNHGEILNPDAVVERYVNKHNALRLRVIEILKCIADERRVESDETLVMLAAIR